MTYSVILTPEGRFQITHSKVRMVGNWVYDSEADARRVIAEMTLDEKWERFEEARAERAWDDYVREYGDE